MKDSPFSETTVSNSTPRTDRRSNSVPLTAHLSLIGAATFWGLMSPLGKDAMTHGFDGIDMVSFRVAGGALLFWIASLFVPREAISRRDILWLCVAAVFGLVGNQCCFTVGLSLTSPINAGIATTSMPIFALVLSALVLREPVTWRKAVGVALGCVGALLLVWSSARAAGASVGMGNLRGDLLCLAAQFSYSIYLTVFGRLAKRYSVVTVNKWMFLSAQPIVAALVSILLGLAVLTVTHAVAAALIFTGVAMVTLSKSRRDLNQPAEQPTPIDAVKEKE